MRRFLLNLGFVAAVACFCIGAFKLSEWLGYMMLGAVLLGSVALKSFRDFAKQQGGRK